MSARTIASYARGNPVPYDPEALIEAMFAGPRASLRPIYDRLLRLGLVLGEDVRVCPASTIVPLYRTHVFAQVRPATASRLDMGYALRSTAATGRLVDTGGLAKGDRITHRIPLKAVDDVDGEVKRWFKVAYELDG